MIERILFRGAAWGVITYFGAIQAIELERQRENSCISKDVKLHGLSAGALVLLLHVVGYTEREMCDLYEHYFDKSRTNFMKGSVLDVTEINMELLKGIFGAHPDAYMKMNEANVRIGVTTEKGFRFIKDFQSNFQLANVLMCTFHIPCLSSFDACIDGERALDGGIGFNASVFVESNRNCSLIIGASHSESHINFDMSTMFLLVPPPKFLHNHYLALGYNRTCDILRSGTIRDENIVGSYTNLSTKSLWWIVRDQMTTVTPVCELEKRIVHFEN